MKLLVTGGSGFIGSHFIRNHLNEFAEDNIVNLDKLTYAGRRENTIDFEKNPKYAFIQGDVTDYHIVEKAMRGCESVVHFAAESHVDNAIDGSKVFLETNVMGTHALLEQAKKQRIEKFVQISTDEVYGQILSGSFKETDACNPRSPYSASKLAADRLAYSYYVTHGLPVMVTRASNNFGSHQYPEKLIPFFCINLLQGKKVTLYGDGKNIRDWLHVSDHCNAIETVLEKGKPGETYNVGDGTELTNLQLTRMILAEFGFGDDMIEWVPDRPGHDRRYSVDSSKLHALGWKPGGRFEEKLCDTVEWYKQNESWWKPLVQRAEQFRKMVQNRGK